jgi:hypothetical protein
MTRILISRHAVFPILILLLFAVSLACGATGVASPSASATEQIVIQSDINYGSGPFDLLDTKTGLSDLSSYTAAVTITFDGTRDGKAEKSSKAYTMLVTADPQARQVTIEKSSGSSSPVSVFMAETDGLGYEKPASGACTANAVQQGFSLADRLEPASFLSPLIGATEAGSETANQVDATRYTFDQLALGEQGQTESTGEVWVAKEGGYIVKYLLTRKGHADYFGGGLEGMQTLDYELTGVNQKATITLPEDCPPGMVDAPLLSDAADVMKSPGRLAYTTASSIADAAAYYETQKMPGWKVQDAPAVTDKGAFLSFVQGDQLMIIFISIKGGKTNVTITIGHVQK